MGRPHLIGRLLERDRRIVIAAMAIAVAACAAFIVSGGGTGMSSIGMTRMTGPAGALIAQTPDMLMPVAWTPGYAAVIFLMWWLMMVAMMVPSVAPVVLLYGALRPERGAAGQLEFLAGYLCVWALFSLAATAVQAALTTSGLLSAMFMSVTGAYLGSGLLIGAGLYQFTPLKSACLASCRGPVEALASHRRTGRAAAFRMGLSHGGYCLGCCWALMVLLFVGGVMNLWWVMAIAVYVAIEKLAPGGDRIARFLGVALILAGLALAARTAGIAWS